MTIFVLKGELNGKIVVARFFLCWVYILRRKKKIVFDVLLLYDSVNNFSVTSGRFPIFIGYRQERKYLLFCDLILSHCTSCI